MRVCDDWRQGVRMFGALGHRRGVSFDLEPTGRGEALKFVEVIEVLVEGVLEKRVSLNDS